MERQTEWEARAADHARARVQAARAGNGNGSHAERSYPVGAAVVPLRDDGGIECSGEVELVIFRFMSFGRLAHFRRSLLSLPQVLSARIRGYGDQTAYFSIALTPGTRASSLAVPGTRLLAANGGRVELCVEGW